MNITQIENNLKHLIDNFNEATFIYDLLLAYNTPKASVARLQKGNMNLSKIPGEIVWKKKLFFKEAKGDDLAELVENMGKDSRVSKHALRFAIATDNERLLAIDTKTKDRLDIDIKDLPKKYDFFLPLAGMEKNQHYNENPADVKAAERMAKLFDEIRRNNATDTPEKIHSLNVFLSRLLFCYFAEDTGIFKDRVFTNSISSHTQEDGSDVHTYLERLFTVLNTPKNERSGLPAYLDEFEYVNGGLFRETHPVPVFTTRARKLLIEIGELDWADINPDIFGSMMQAVVDPEERGSFGMHYTSVPNIMKVIEPLFLNELREQFEKSKYEPQNLNKLLHRIGRIKIFDPACGSGNFLIIAYKKLRELEIDILKQLQELSRIASGFERQQLELIPKAQLTLAAAYKPTMFTNVKLTQFYGIELKDFAHELAILSLWLAQHQMNTKFKEVFGAANATLPLTDAGNITLGNATRIDWEQVCPKEKGDYIYILGNPPYKGAKLQTINQREDLASVFKNTKDYKNLDYISCWVYKAAIYINNTEFEAAFVTTKSVVQGNQVGLLWPYIYAQNIEIGFAYPPFKWENNAKDNAGVQVVIFSIRSNWSTKEKYIFSNYKKLVSNIGPYLNSGPSIIVSSRRNSISKLPEMVFGNMPLEGNYLKLSQDEKEKIIESNPNTSKFIKPLIGGEEFLKSIPRYCLWIEDNELEEAKQNPLVDDRIKKVYEFRQAGGEVARTLLNRSHQFRYRRVSNNGFILVPRTTSERREYMQCGFFGKSYIPIESAQVIYDSEPYIFSILSAKIHMLWVKAVGGYLGTSIRYSTEICYNTFPFPEINSAQKVILDQHGQKVLAEREKHSEKTLAQLYDPDIMPEGLRAAHHQLDMAVERCYRSKPFESDEERLEYLFKLYEKMIEEERNKGTLYAQDKKKSTKKKIKTT